MKMSRDEKRHAAARVRGWRKSRGLRLRRNVVTPTQAKALHIAPSPCPYRRLDFGAVQLAVKALVSQGERVTLASVAKATHYNPGSLRALLEREGTSLEKLKIESDLALGKDAPATSPTPPQGTTGGRCIEDHPTIAKGWYFWNGCMFDGPAEPTHWMPLPATPEEED